MEACAAAEACADLRLPAGSLRAGRNARTLVGRVPRAWLRALLAKKRLPAVEDGGGGRRDSVGVLVVSIERRDGRALPLQRAKPPASDRGALSYSQLLRYAAQTNHRNLWREAHRKRAGGGAEEREEAEAAAAAAGGRGAPTVNVVERDAALAEAIARVYGCRTVRLTADGAVEPRSKSPSSKGPKAEPHPNTLPAWCAVETERRVHVLHRYDDESTLLDALSFAPALFERSRARKLFALYQLLRAFESAHDRGLFVGDVGLEDAYVGADLWLRTLPALERNLLAAPPDRVRERPARGARRGGDEEEQRRKRERAASLETLCELWTRGRVSNLDYLLRLNELAGRREGEPNAHPVVPWVTDFTARNGERWRDLTKSKYRLTKGDRQLDLTYDSSSKDPQQIPHHVSDVLSDITYYVYTARRTPKSTLIRHVRQNWVPAEYPNSIQRMQEWTPDECIPEFYSDPTVFRSIHEDLPDLGVPAWATCVEDFVAKHREALESSQVSESLHHWIDLTFGFKLSGPAAIKAKNVCLFLVDDHVELDRTGPVQLFTHSHPARLSSNSKEWGERLPPRIVWHGEKKKKQRESSEEASDYDDTLNVPQNVSPLSGSRGKSNSCIRNRLQSNESLVQEVLSSTSSTVEPKSESARQRYRVQKSEMDQGIIYLPKEFNPVSRLNAVENLHNFKLKTFYSQIIPPVGEKENSGDLKNSQKSDSVIDIFETEFQSETNSFTNRIFEQQNYFHRSHSKQDMKDKKGKSSNTRYVTDLSYFKEIVLQNRKKDMQVLGCLIVELFLHQKLRPLKMDFNNDFNRRYKTCQTVLRNNTTLLPTSVLNIACSLLQINNDCSSDGSIGRSPMANASDTVYPPISSIGLPPPSCLQLLQPLLFNFLLPFPSDFPELYATLVVLHEYSITESELDITCSFECDGRECSKYQSLDKTRFYFSRKIAEAKVNAFSLYLENNLHRDSSFNQFDKVDIIFPYFVRLLQNKETCILAAWYLFDPIAKALGPSETRKKLLALILNLYDEQIAEKSGGNEVLHMTIYSNKKSVKLYHNIFLLRLIIRFGLQCFLENFISHLVEAVGGYKDIPSNDVTLHSHNNNSEKLPQNSIKKLTCCDDPVKNLLNAPHDAISPDTSCGSENIITPNTDKDCLHTGDKMKKINVDNISENELFHFEAEDAKDASTPKSTSDVDSIKSWDMNKSKIKCLLEEIDLECSSPNLENYLDHTQAIEATESIIINRDEAEKETRKELSPKKVDEVDRAYNERLNLLSPSINAVAPNQTFTSYVKLDENVVDQSQEALDSSEAKLNFVMSKFGEDNIKESSDAMAKSELSGEVKEYKVSEMTSESLIWLAHRLGPVLTCKYITRNLLKMLTLCYIGQENLLPAKVIEHHALDSLAIANGLLVGDKNALRVIECLTSIASLYGEQLILLQYFPHMGDLIASCRKRISAPLEGGLVASLQLLRYLIPYLSDGKLMEQLQDIILKNILHPIVRLISSMRSTFPSGHVARSALARKFLETLYILALRIGPEMAKKHLCVPALQRFCLSFDKAFEKSHTDSSNVEDNVAASLKDTTIASDEPGSELRDEGTSFLEICRDGTTTEWRIKDGKVVCEAEGMGDLESSPSHALDRTLINSVIEEVKIVFTCELAYQSFIPFAKLIGEDVLERSLKNYDLLKELSDKYEKYEFKKKSEPSTSAKIFNEPKADENPFFAETYSSKIERSESIAFQRSPNMEETSNANSFGSNVAIIGNRIDVQSTPNEDNGFISTYNNDDALEIVSFKMDNGIRSNRHLRGDWLMYWEHEIGRSDKDNRFNLKQIKLQTFAGHTHSVRNIICLDNENSFMTASKDKTVKLWSLRNQGDGTAISSCQWTYGGHRKGILSMSFLESHRYTVSTDSVVHIWDPYVESTIAQLDNPKLAPVSIVKAMAAPSSLILAATTDTVLKVIDARTCLHAHELKVTLNPNTFIRCICVSPSGKWVAIGLATGHLSLLDPRTGAILSYWKGHDGEVLQLVAMNENIIVSSSLDQTVSAWSTVDGKLKIQLKGSTEPVHCLATYYEELISGTTNNRIGVHSSIEQDPAFSSTKLRSDTFKGVLTSMAVLPLNRMLLLGGESGNISLLC